MSIKYLNDAWDMPVNSTEKLLLLAIADCANNEGYAYPGYETLVKKTGMSKSTISKCMKVLKGAGILKSESHGEIGRGKKVNTYTISLRCELIYSTHHELIEKINGLRKTHSNAISTHPELRKVHTPNSISTHPEHEPSVLTIIKEPPVIIGKKEIVQKPEKPKQETKQSEVILLLSEYGIEGELAKDFITHRKVKKAAITSTVLKGFQSEANKAGIPTADAVRCSIESNWQGFNADWFFNKQGNNNGNTKTSFSSNRKLSLVDAAKAGEQRILARMRREAEKQVN